MRVDEFFRGFNTRLVIILLLFGALGGMCMLRLWSEQVQGGRKHREAVSRQSIRRIRVPPIRGRIFSADGKLFTVSGDGRITVLTLGPNPKILATNDMTDEVYATPAIVDGTIYVRTHAALFAFQEEVGR